MTTMADTTTIEELVTKLLEIGEREYGWEIDDESFEHTPGRVKRMLDEMYDKRTNWKMRNFDHKPTEEHVNGIVVVKDIPYMAFCEHHLVPFWGKAHIAYLAGEKLTGASKLARMVDTFAYQPTIQEKLASKVADAVMKNIEPLACMVVTEGTHGCMIWRGVRSHGSKMVHSEIRGEMDNGIKEEMKWMIRN